MNELLTFNRKIKLFRDLDITSSISLTLHEEDDDQSSSDIMAELFITIRNNFFKMYPMLCVSHNKDPDTDFIKAQFEEIQTDFTYWVRSKC